MLHPLDPRRRRDLNDQSKLLNKRARRQIATSRERIERSKHTWNGIALGRICLHCLTAQATGEFDEAVPCRSASA